MDNVYLYDLLDGYGKEIEPKVIPSLTVILNDRKRKTFNENFHTFCEEIDIYNEATRNLIEKLLRTNIKIVRNDIVSVLFKELFKEKQSVINEEEEIGKSIRIDEDDNGIVDELYTEDNKYNAEENIEKLSEIIEKANKTIKELETKVDHLTSVIEFLYDKELKQTVEKKDTGFKKPFIFFNK